MAQHPQSYLYSDGSSSLIEPLESRIAPAMIVVTTLTDDAHDPGKTLREAIDQANSHTGPDKITFKDNLHGTIHLTASLPVILDDLSIEGQGITIDGGNQFQIFNIHSGSIAVVAARPIDVALSGLTLTHGAAVQGGAVAINDFGGTVTIGKCVITENQATGDGNSGEDGEGGGIFNEAGSLVLMKSTVSNNVAIGGAGDAGTAGSGDGGTGGLGGDGSDGIGGGIFNLGSLTILRSTITGNTAQGGAGGTGGIGSDGYSNLYTGSTGGTGGQGGNAGTGEGGGIFSQGLMDLQKSTVSGNQALGGLGGAGGKGGTGGYDHDLFGGPGGTGGTGGIGGTGGLSGGGGISDGSFFLYGFYSYSGLQASSTTIGRSTISGNSAIGGAGGAGGFFGSGGGSSYGSQGGDGLYGTEGNGAYASGGGITDSGALTVLRTVISGNTVTGGAGNKSGRAYGGGITTTVGNMILAKSTIDGNTATDGQGGGIFTAVSGVTINASTLSNNAAADGGGIFGQVFTSLHVVNSTIAKNHALDGDGGGLLLVPFESPSIVLTNDTIADNSASGSGGGIWTGTGVRVAPGFSESVHLISSIVAHNTAGSDPDVQGSVNANYSLIENPDTAFISGNNNFFNIDPHLGALGDHGGPTATMVPSGGSIAVNHGLNFDFLNKDQRGQHREQGPRIDMGAVEVG